MANNFLALLSSLYASSCLLNRGQHSLPKDYSRELRENEAFDVVVIGAGAAGCVLAKRLTENGQFRVLLVEAGNYPTSGTEVPGLFFANFKSDMDWSYENERAPNTCLGYDREACTTVGGKVLGGSTTINGMLYTRALPETYNTWSRMGNTGWDYESVRGYYEQFEGSTVKTDDYGKGGNLTLSNTRSDYNRIKQMLYDSSGELGEAWTNGDGGLGMVECYSAMRNNTRCSAVKAFLTRRGNLYVSVKTRATKILFRGKKATGVQLKIRNKYVNIRATREIIVSAGSIESPKLLMLSGVGPKAHLNSLSVNVIADLPVGKNFHDHLLLPAIIATIPDLEQRANYPKAVLDYCTRKHGILSTLNIYNIQWFLNTQNRTEQSDMAIQFYYIQRDVSGLTTRLMKNVVNFKTATMDSLRKIVVKSDALQFGCLLTEPFSTGEILLRSTDSDDKPRIIGNYLKDARDLAALLHGIKRIKSLLNTPTMRRFNVQLRQLDLPNCRGFTFQTDAYWKCYAENLATPSYHPAGSCKMAPIGDETGVVTPDLKVVGLENLRVADASIMPKIVDRNLMSSVYVIAHKAADLILRDLTTT